MRTEDLNAGDKVLIHDTPRFMNRKTSNKLAFRWLGPYLINEAFPQTGTFTLKELDGTLLRGTYAGNRLKKFHTREILPTPVSQGTADLLNQGEEDSTVDGPVTMPPDEDFQDLIPPDWNMAVVIPS